MLAADDERDGSREIDAPGRRSTGTRHCGDGGNAHVRQPRGNLDRRPRCNRHGEEGSLRCTDDVGVPYVGRRRGDDDGVGADTVCRPQHGAEVARLLDPLDDQQQRLGAEVELIEIELRGAADGDDAVGVLLGRRRGGTHRRRAR